MAYFNQEMKKQKSAAVKEIAKKYGMKISLAVRNYSVLVANIPTGCIDFGKDHATVNQFTLRDTYSGKSLEFLEELVSAMMDGNHDRSDSQADYHDVGWYIDINIGKWDKPYQVI